IVCLFFFSSRRRHTRFSRDWSSDVCSSDLDLPDFMVFLDWKSYPWYWSFTDHLLYAALLIVLVPGALAFLFGYFAFRSRIKGVRSEERRVGKECCTRGASERS